MQEGHKPTGSLQREALTRPVGRRVSLPRRPRLVEQPQSPVTSCTHSALPGNLALQVSRRGLRVCAVPSLPATSALEWREGAGTLLPGPRPSSVQVPDADFALRVTLSPLKCSCMGSFGEPCLVPRVSLSLLVGLPRTPGSLQLRPPPLYTPSRTPNCAPHTVYRAPRVWICSKCSGLPEKSLCRNPACSHEQQGKVNCTCSRAHVCTRVHTCF